MFRPAIRYYRSTLLMLFGVVALAMSASVVQAGPVTNHTANGGTAPFTRLGIYKQSLQIVGTNTTTGKITFLRFGNNGQDIAGSGDILFRPSDPAVTNSVTTEKNSVQIKKFGTYDADIYIPGDLCLTDHANGNAVVCKHQLIGGAASTLWQAGTSVDAYLGTTFTYLEPKKISSGDTTQGVQLGSATNPLSGQAMNIGGTANIVAMNTGSSGGLAADFQGSVTFGNPSGGTVFVYGATTIGGNVPWSGDNQGEGSGFDADMVNGNQVTIEPATSCTDSNVNKPRLACICFSIKYPQDWSNSSTKYVHTNIPPVKHCTDIGNWY